MDTASKLNKLLETKEQIRHSIEKKGVEIGKDVPFADYPNKISEITSGEGSGDSTTYENPNFYEIRTNGGTDYSYLFNNYNGTSLDIGNWKTSNVTNMEMMFKGCENLKELSLSSFEIREDCNTYCMFLDCNRLHTLQLKSCNEDTIRKIIESDMFPTGKAEDYDETRKIFVKKENVGKLTPPDGWVFVDCKTGEIIPVNYEKDMFRDNRDIKEVGVMVTKEHTDLSDMFSDCENLKTINGIKDWDTSNVETMTGMFAGCKSLESLDLSNFNTSQVTNMDTMFFNCENLRELNLSNFEIKEECNTDLMFRECRRLHTLRLDNCSRETVEKIIYSSDLPTGGAEDYEGTRKIYVSRSLDSSIQPPDGWAFAMTE